ncbi:MAG: endonuclease MutS2 [Bacteroidota bacterium]
MLRCDRQTYQDLEFDALLEMLSAFCVGPTAARRSNRLRPVRSQEELVKFLEQTNELTNIRREGETFPRLEFEELNEELRMLPIQNATLPQESFQRIRAASALVNALLYFFNKRELEYPQLSKLLEHVYFTKEVIETIDQVFDKHGQIKDDASEELKLVRERIVLVERKTNSVFDRTIRKYLKKGYLSDTKEAFMENRRLMAVLSSYKRQVEGQVFGSSKTGHVTYIEPGATVPHNKELERLRDDERQEVFRILRRLTRELASHFSLLKAYHQLLVNFDFINAKSRLALQFDAVLPGISDDQHIDLIDAYHPILQWNNSKAGKKTVPQHISMDRDARMLVISGPNAGGKSITLKTVGLLQLMIQCGLLVPVHPNSKMTFFKALLTDIGDNQSIVDELSTYSYRLKRMRHFLNVADEETLLLLDEFGTGSDPDLGGALAEVFFEQLYEQGSFGVLTTHYGNIKLKADELNAATNGCMLFDTDTLQPLFKFSMGQPGSSFTFEVAQINGIPPQLIHRAKGKLDDRKVKMDRLLHELQQEKSYLSRLTKDHIEAQETAESARVASESAKASYEEKLSQLRERAESTNKLLNLGKKMQQFIDRFRTNSKKKNINSELMQEVKKYIAREKAKIESLKKEEILKKKAVQKQKKPTKKAKQYHQGRIREGSTVKMIATKQKGEVEQIEGDEVTVLFGFARMKVQRDQLIWIKDNK